MDPESSLYIMSALAHKKYALSDGSFREIKHNTISWNFFLNKHSGAVVMSPDSEGLGAAVEAGEGWNLTQSSGISYFSQYIRNYMGQDQFLVVNLIFRLNIWELPYLP